MITKKQAKGLAVAYQAYCERSMAQDFNGMRVWGTILKKAQAETGVTLISNILTQEGQHAYDTEAGR